MLNLASYPVWTIVSLVLIIVLIVIHVAVAASLDRRSSRLPEATKWDDLSHRLMLADVQLKEKADALRVMDQKISERDRIAAEAAALSEHLEALKTEVAGLAEAERQVDEMKHRAAEAVEAYAAESGKLAELRTELTRAEAEVANANQAVVELRNRAEVLQRDIDRLRESLPDDIDGLWKEIERLKALQDSLAAEIDALRSERSSLIAAREEAAAMAVRRATLEEELRSLYAEIQSARESDELTSLYNDRTQLIGEIAELRAQRAAAAEILTEIGGLSSRKAALEEDLQRKHEEIAALEETWHEVEQLRAERTTLIDARNEITDLSARKAVLEREISRLEGTPSGEPEDEGVEDLIGLPSCLKNASDDPMNAQQESDALEDVAQYLYEIGLKYDRRTVAAFHTALKINETSQMTVLAGVSGTGKSLLPRRYAEAMGIHFLQIAVEPRWDSPQDLLGFYNYIEKRYRGTDLARALVHLDPFDTSGLRGGDFGDHVLLVLLDEMNLARVEYYFSEFLSRLELRPKWADAQDPTRRVNASLPIEIRGRKQGPIRLFPSANILFAGTMNDDESTQALSDKVLDRSNVMQFAAPGEFAKPIETQHPPASSRYRTYEAWRRWIRTPDALTGGDRDRADRTIRQLAVIMENCGRPFGHRLNEAMLTYVANYPRQRNDTVAAPLADQLEFRILPKLRGLAIEDYRQTFDDLTKLVREDLGDRPLADQLDMLIDRQRSGSGQFNWRGLDRSRG